MGWPIGGTTWTGCRPGGRPWRPNSWPYCFAPRWRGPPPRCPGSRCSKATGPSIISDLMDRLQARWATLATQFLAVLLCTALARSATTVPRIEVLEGDGAINNIRLHRAKEPVVRVVDQDGHPIPNVAVTFLLQIGRA